MKIKMLLAIIIVLTLLLITSCSFIPGPLSVEATPELFPIIQNGKLGYINRKGEVVIQPQFSSRIHFFSEGLAAVCIESGKCGYIDQTGKYVINPQFESVSDFSEGLAAVVVENKTGYIDKTGKIIINPQFDMDGKGPGGMAQMLLCAFSEGLASVRIGGKYGYIDKSGKIIINPQFEYAFPFSEGLAAVSMGNKFGYVDKEGKISINPQFDGATPFINGLAVVAVDKKYGYIDKAGKYVVNPQFDFALSFSDDGLACVGVGEFNLDNGGKYGFIDKDGNYVINPQFEGRTIGGPHSEIFFLPKFRFKTLHFSEGLASIMIGGVSGNASKMGYVDKTGKIVINPQFRGAYSFWGGLALVETESGMAYIDKEGKFVWRETRETPKPQTNTNTYSNSNASMNNTSTNMPVSNTSSTLERTGRLTTDANIRSEANKDSASLGIHFKDARVIVLDETSYERDGMVTTWYKIRVTEYGCSKDTSLGCGKNSPNDADEGWVNAKVVLLN